MTVPANVVPQAFRRFHDSVQQFTEISDLRPSFYRHASRSQYRLDRACWSLPPHTTRFSYVSGGTIGSLYSNWRAGVSDHSAIFLSLRRDGSHDSDCPRPILSWITRHVTFKHNLKALIRSSEISCWGQFEQDPHGVSHRCPSEDLTALNILIRRAAAQTRNQMLAEADASGGAENHTEAIDLLLTSIARAQYFQDFFFT